MTPIESRRILVAFHREALYFYHNSQLEKTPPNLKRAKRFLYLYGIMVHNALWDEYESKPMAIQAFSNASALVSPEIVRSYAW